MPATSEDEDLELRRYRRRFVLKIVLTGVIVVVAIVMSSMVVLTLRPMMAARRERAQRAKFIENEKLKENLRQIGIGLHNNEQFQQEQQPSKTTDVATPAKE